MSETAQDYPAPSAPPQYVIPDDQHRSNALSFAVHGPGAPALTEEILARAHSFYAFMKGEVKAAVGRKPKATAAAAPAETAKPAAAPAAAASVDVDVLGDEGSDNFLNEDEPAAAATPAAKKVTIEDVRAALLALQQRTDAKTARNVLTKSSNGADTLGKIKPDLFQAVINAAVAQKDKIA